MNSLIRHILFLISLFLFRQTALSQQPNHKESDAEKWQFPANVDTYTNPYSRDAAALEDGKVLYLKLCSVCHGTKGKGDGIAAAGLQVRPADHTSAEIQSQSDGHLFWELTKGHAPMPSYENTLTEKQRWELVTFIRTLKPKVKSKSHSLKLNLGDHKNKNQWLLD